MPIALQHHAGADDDAFRQLSGAGLDVVWLQYLIVFGTGTLFMVLALRRFGRLTAASIG